MDVSVVMPCLNEEKTVGICIQKAKKVFKNIGLNGEVIVSNNNSSDASADVAEKQGAIVVKQLINGYGATYLKGLALAKGKYIVIADSDNTYDFSEMPKFLEQLDNGCDFVIGNRFLGNMEQASMKPLHKYIGNPFLNFVFNALFYTDLGDTHCGFRAFTKSAFKKMNLQTQGMEFALEMVVNSAKLNLKIAEVPVNYYKRQGPSNLKSFQDGARHMSFMFHEWLK
ncbi:MAG: glycosyltransferase family 2 protein [archaeon]|nr:glycosyltransferase family 2 protein [archaeon]